MAEIDKWVKMLTGEISGKKAEPLLTRGVAKLQAFLETHPQAQQRVVDILRRRLNGEINAGTWQVMNDSLSQYFSQELAYLLYWVVNVEDPSANRMVEVEQYVSSKVMAFLQTVVGIYGPDLSEAYAHWNQLRDSWRTIYRDVYYDQLNERYHIRVRIEKYNGEEVVFEGNPDSILTLASYLVRTAYMVGTGEAFSPGSVNLFANETKVLAKLLSPEQEEVPSEQPAGEAASDVP